MGAFGWALERSLPFLLVLYVLGTSFTMFQVAYLGTIVVDGGILWGVADLALGWALLALWMVFFACLVSSLLTGWWFSWMHAPFWMPDGPLTHALWYRPFLLPALVFPGLRPWFARLSRSELPPRPAPARWQQARKEWGVNLHVGGHEILEDDRPNYCIREGRPDCRNSDVLRRDRMYHAHWPYAFRFNVVDSCLPVWDHWCHWLGIGVYLHTIKPYLLAIMYLLAYSAYVSAVFFWAATQKRFKHIFWWTFWFCGFGFLIVEFLAGLVLIPRLRDLVYHQKTDYELRHPNTFTMALPLSNGVYFLTMPPCNPWDQGTWGRNWCHVMGRNWYEWLVPFWQPQRVRDYDDPDKPGFDEKFGDEFLIWTLDWSTTEMIAAATRPNDIQPPRPAATRSRRGDAWSSGSDIPWGNARQRRPQLDV